MPRSIFDQDVQLPMTMPYPLGPGDCHIFAFSMMQRFNRTWLEEFLHDGGHGAAAFFLDNDAMTLIDSSCGKAVLLDSIGSEYRPIHDPLQCWKRKLGMIEVDDGKGRVRTLKPIEREAFLKKMYRIQYMKKEIIVLFR